MQVNQIEEIAIEILREAEGKFLFPYQIFNRIRQRNPSLGRQIVEAYSTEPDRPVMGKGAGKSYTVALFISQALNRFKYVHPEIQKEKFDSDDIRVEDIEPGNEESVSIWAWKESRRT